MLLQQDQKLASVHSLKRNNGIGRGKHSIAKLIDELHTKPKVRSNQMSITKVSHQ